MKKKFKGLVLVLTLVLLLAACGGQDTGTTPGGSDEPAGGDEFPDGRITVIVPFNAGGSLDLMVRSLQPYWEEELGANIVVENYAGAATLVGTTHFQAQPKDGYYIYAGTQPYLSAAILSGNADFDIDDFDLINFQQLDPACITVLADSPYETLQDLVDAIQANPGQIRVGTINGGASHVLLEILVEKYDLDVRLVTYDSGNDYRTALLGEHVDFVASSAQGDVSLGDAVRVLAHCGDERLTAWPDSPTFKELGIEVPSLGSGRLLAVHPDVQANYPDRFAKLVESYEAAFNSDGYQQQLIDSGELDTSSVKGNEASNQMNKGIHETMFQYIDIITD